MLYGKLYASHTLQKRTCFRKLTVAAFFKKDFLASLSLWIFQYLQTVRLLCLVSLIVAILVF